MPQAPSVPGFGGVPPTDRSRLGPRGSPPGSPFPARSGHDIGELADVMTQRTRNRSPDATDVVPTRGRDHACRHLHQEVPRLTGPRIMRRSARIMPVQPAEGLLR